MSENIGNLTVNLTVSLIRLGPRFSNFSYFWSSSRFSKISYDLGLKKYLVLGRSGPGFLLFVWSWSGSVTELRPWISQTFGPALIRYEPFTHNHILVRERMYAFSRVNGDVNLDGQGLTRTIRSRPKLTKFHQRKSVKNDQAQE